MDKRHGTLVTIAKDVKIQIEFNPALVGGYRLIGYENRLMPARDFNDDRKDAGEIGAGHTVTALYEIVPVGQPIHTTPGVDPLKYQTGVRDGNPAPVRDGAPVSVVPAAAVASGQPQLTSAAHSGEMMTIKLRYKQPDGDTSKVIERAVNDSGAIFSSTSTDFRFAGAVAGFGMILRDSPYKGDANLDNILEFAQGAVGADSGGYRTEFIELVRKARAIRGGRY